MTDHLELIGAGALVVVGGGLVDVLRRRVGRWAEAVLAHLGRLASLPETVDTLAHEVKAAREDHERRIVRLEHHTGLETP